MGKPTVSNHINDSVHLPNGVIVRICTPRPSDHVGVERLLTCRDAVSAGELPANDSAADDVLVAIGHWETQVVAFAAWRRLPGARASAAVSVARELADTPLAAHMLVRLARLADAALISTLVVAPLRADDRLAAALRDVFGAQPADGGVELRTEDWPQALARVDRTGAPGFVATGTQKTDRSTTSQPSSSPSHHAATPTTAAATR